MAETRNVPNSRSRGVVTTWNDSRGYGFITPVAGGDNVFVHIKAFSNTATRPKVDDQVSFELVLRDGKRQATLVRFIETGVVAALRRSTAGQPGPSGASRAGTKSRRPARGAPIRRGLAYLTIPVFGALCVAVSVRWAPPLWILGIYVAASILCYVAYAADKSAAMAGSWRTSEKTLLILGALGGWPGAIIAQERLRHKTRKIHFQLLFWATVIINITAFVAISRAIAQ